MADSLRRIRRDDVAGVLTEKEYRQVEMPFREKLSQQRNILQLLCRAAG